MKVIFCCDGSASIGMGHLMRCLVLAKEFRKHANRVLFATRKNVAVANLLRKNNFSVLWLRGNDGFINKNIVSKLCREKADLLIVDSYEMDEKSLNLLNKNFMKTAIIDDNAELKNYKADYVINGNIFASKLMYKKHDNKTKFFLGNKFALLSEDFLKHRKDKLKEKTKNLLITFGGSDPENQTIRLVKLLNSFSHNFKVRIITGGFYKDFMKLKKYVKNTACDIKIFRNVKNMSIHMKWADLAVSGAGTTAYELASTGTPAILLVLADNQLKIAEKLDDTGAAYNLGYYKDISDDDIKKKIINLALSFKKRKKMSQAGKRLFKERGAKNIADILLQKNMQESYFYKILKKDIIREYQKSAKFKQDYKKAKWGSHESMLNRFKLFKNTVSWKKVKSWLDIGCANGALFDYCSLNNVKCTGIDICGDMVKGAGKKYKILVCDAEKLPFKNSSFDLISMMGVLQQCGAAPGRILEECLRVLKKRGRLFLTTKNLLWEEFITGNFMPYEKHSWFVPQEIKNILIGLGAKIIKMAGFLPRDGRVVPIEKSHSFYILAEK